MSAQPRKSLGRGLDALFSDGLPEPPSSDQGAGASAGATGADLVAIERLHPNPFQPRRHFNADEIEDLARSVRDQGVLQPLLVRPDPAGAGQMQIIAGERRWRAAQRAGLGEVPVIVRQLDDGAALQIAIVENIQRQDLDAIEEATAYRRLTDEFGHTHDSVATAVGKSRSHISNLLRLLDLPAAVQDRLAAGSLTMGHARALLACPDPAAAAAIVVRDGLSVRQTEDLARSQGRRPKAATAQPAADPDLQALEQDVSDHLGLRVRIEPAGRGQGGRLAIHYRDLDQLDAVLARLRTRTAPH